MIALLGLSVFILLAWGLSEKKKHVPWKFVFKALLLQFGIALLLLKVPLFVGLFSKLNGFVLILQDVTTQATGFLFGYLAGSPAPFQIVQPENNFIVAIRVLPLILVVSALSAVLFHWRILPALVHGLAFVLKKILGISGALGFGGASTVFFGTIEAPLLVRPYLKGFNRADLFALITCSMTTISGTVMVLYASVLEKVVPNALSHLLIASIMSVPAAMIMARIVVPPDPINSDEKENIKIKSPYLGTMDALLKGISEGINIILSILGVILVFFALIYLLNKGLSLLSPEITLEGILGTLLRPVMWLTGISWSESNEAARLMGTKIALNEFVAFLELSKIYQSLSGQGRTILTYALCGFANFASVGIIVGGLTAILPERQQEIAGLTFKSLITGNLATLMTAAIAGLFL